jgi:hypothetical protein
MIRHKYRDPRAGGDQIFDELLLSNGFLAFAGNDVFVCS